MQKMEMSVETNWSNTFSDSVDTREKQVNIVEQYHLPEKCDDTQGIVTPSVNIAPETITH